MPFNPDDPRHADSEQESRRRPGSRIIGDELPLDDSGELELPAELASLASQLSEEAELLESVSAGWRQRSDFDPKSLDTPLVAVSKGTMPSAGSDGTSSRGVRLLLGASLAGFAALTLTIVLLRTFEFDRQGGEVAEVAPVVPVPASPGSDSAVEARSADARRPVGDPAETATSVSEDADAWSENPFVSHPVPVPLEPAAPEMFLEELSGPELEGWMDLQQQQQDARPTEISI